MSVLHITKENFENEVLQSAKPVLVDFFAPWCGPCRMVGPVLEEIAAEREDLVIAKINVDEEPELAQRYGVVSIPTLMVVEEGKVKLTSLGFRPKEEILSMFE